MQIAFVDGKAVPCRITSKQVYSLFPQGLAGLHRIKADSSYRRISNSNNITNYNTSALATSDVDLSITATSTDVEWVFPDGNGVIVLEPQGHYSLEPVSTNETEQWATNTTLTGNPSKTKTTTTTASAYTDGERYRILVTNTGNKSIYDSEHSKTTYPFTNKEIANAYKASHNYYTCENGHNVATPVHARCSENNHDQSAEDVLINEETLITAPTQNTILATPHQSAFVRHNNEDENDYLACYPSQDFCNSIPSLNKMLQFGNNSQLSQSQYESQEEQLEHEQERVNKSEFSSQRQKEEEMLLQKQNLLKLQQEKQRTTDGELHRQTYPQQPQHKNSSFLQNTNNNSAIQNNTLHAEQQCSSQNLVEEKNVRYTEPMYVEEAHEFARGVCPNYSVETPLTSQSLITQRAANVDVEHKLNSKFIPLTLPCHNNLNIHDNSRVEYTNNMMTNKDVLESDEMERTCTQPDRAEWQDADMHAGNPIIPIPAARECKIIKDCIHEYIKLPMFAFAIIDTPEFQRLRWLKQLGTACYLYPNATHTRFEHCIGVAYMASQMVQQLALHQPELRISAADILCVTIAGLCHDIGHGPFSHLFEQIVNYIRNEMQGSLLPLSLESYHKRQNGGCSNNDNYTNKNLHNDHKTSTDSNKNDTSKNINAAISNTTTTTTTTVTSTNTNSSNPNIPQATFVTTSPYCSEPEREWKETGHWQHEMMSIRLLRRILNRMDLSVYGLNDADARFIELCITGLSPSEPWPSNIGRPEHKRFLVDIVANKRHGIDVDKLDYFQRDSHGAYGRATVDVNFTRLLNACRVLPFHGQYQICFEEKMALSLNDIFSLRARLHKYVYQHHIVKKTDNMVRDILVAADPFFTIRGSEGQMLRISECVDDDEAFCRVGDWVLQAIAASNHPSLRAAQDLIERLEQRDLYAITGSATLGRIKPGFSENKIKDELIEIILQDVDETVESSEECRAQLERVILVCFTHITYGSSDGANRTADPMNEVTFFNPKKMSAGAFLLPRDRMSPLFCPSEYSEHSLTVMVRDNAFIDLVAGAFETWKRKNTTYLTVGVPSSNTGLSPQKRRSSLSAQTQLSLKKKRSRPEHAPINDTSQQEKEALPANTVQSWSTNKNDKRTTYNIYNSNGVPSSSLSSARIEATINDAAKANNTNAKMQKSEVACQRDDKEANLNVNASASVINNNNNNNITENKGSINNNEDAFAHLLTLPHTLRNQPNNSIDGQSCPFPNL